MIDKPDKGETTSSSKYSYNTTATAEKIKKRQEEVWRLGRQ